MIALPVIAMPVITLSLGRESQRPAQHPATGDSRSNIGWMVEYS